MKRLVMFFGKKKFSVNSVDVIDKYKLFSNAKNTATPSLNSRISASDYDSITNTHGDYKAFQDAINREKSSIQTNSAIHIHSLSEAWVKLLGILKTNGVNNNGSKIYFRGQSNSDWPIISSAAKKIYELYGDDGIDCANGSIDQGTSNYEKMKFNEYMDHVTELNYKKSMKQQGFIPPKNMNANWWAIMQHEGFPTKFIDFTENFLVALYFACAKWENNVDKFEDIDEVDNPGKDGIVFVMGEKWNEIRLNKDEKENPLLEMKHPKTVSSTDNINYIIKSGVLHPRIIKQQGIFLSSKYLEKNVRIDGYRLIIDKDSKQNILDDLNIIGINRSRLITDWKLNKNND